MFRWTVVVSGTVTDEKPVTFGPFVRCRMFGAKFDGGRFQVTAWTRGIARRLIQLPAGLSVVSVHYGWKDGA